MLQRRVPFSCNFQMFNIHYCLFQHVISFANSLLCLQFQWYYAEYSVQLFVSDNIIRLF
jgi:hypothetical protein